MTLYLDGRLAGLDKLSGLHEGTLVSCSSGEPCRCPPSGDYGSNLEQALSIVQLVILIIREKLDQLLVPDHHGMCFSP